MGARLRTTALVNLAMVVEQANEQVLPAVYLFVGRSLNATPVQLGTLTLCRAMVQTLASPLSGILGDRYDRVLVLSSGAFIWGIMTSALALTVTLRQAMAFAGFNGLGLALLVPCCQSLTADLYPAEQRGRAFGTLQLTASLGGMLGGVFATNMGARRLWGMEGWRAAFHSVAALSLLVGGLALFFAADPRHVRALQYRLLPASGLSLPGLLDEEGGGGHASSLEHAHTHRAGAPQGGPAGGAGDGLVLVGLHGQDGAAAKAPGSGAAMLARPPAASGAGELRRSGSASLLYRPHHGAVAVAVNCQAGEQLLLPQQQQDTAGASSHQHHHGHNHHHARFPGQVVPRSRSFTPGRPAGPWAQQQSGWPAAGGGAAAAAPPWGPPGLKGGLGDAAGSDPGVDVRGRDKGRRRGIVGDVCWMLRIRTFQAIVLQGIVGCFPWQAMVFFTLWLQLNGFSDTTSSLIVATFGAGVAAGALLGGAVGDRMARRLPNSGRILTAQFSVFCGIPLTWLLLKGLPGSVLAGEPLAYAAVMFGMGLTCTWAGAGCNSPIFAEIVPDELRSTIYAFDRSFENSIAACAAPVVGLLAERAFGFSGALTDAALRDDVLRARNAAALGSSLLACMAVPWSLCLVFYSLLHWCYPHDRAAARAWGGGGGGGAHGAAAYMH